MVTYNFSFLIYWEKISLIVKIIKYIYNLYLPSAVFIAQVLVGPSKQLKQIFQSEHNIVKNPNWPEANQLAIYKRGRGFELGATEKQTQVVFRAGLEPGSVSVAEMVTTVCEREKCRAYSLIL